MLQTNDKTGKILAFCKDCALLVITKAVDVFGDKLREIL